jgi:acyl transferase domain-containing protein
MDNAIGDSIAVIGMSGRFPGAQDLVRFWQNLRDGVESISFFSDAALTEAGTDPAVRQDPRYVGAGGVLSDIDLFDASFFGFNPREAEIMDPQQRLFLECAWEALENAGCDPGRCAGAIGVYAGTGISTYFFNLYQNEELVNLVGGHQIMIGNDKDHLTTHVSYKFNLRGPSVTVQTACSTSLVAVSLACRSLLDYQCDMALAGGSSIAVPQGRGYFYHEGGIASPDGHCRAFDAGATGTVVGNGVGVVLLKRLRDAVADGDPIRAVVLGSAINNDGSNKVGYTAPSIDGQAEVIAAAQAVAGVEPSTITYVEAHGTATPLGDPIEVAALQQVFGNGTQGKRCAIGSVKSNIGHLDTSAGIAGFIKTVLALEHQTIPPSLHFRSPNPKLQLDRTPFHVPVAAIPWSSDGEPRRAGVSSFGIGGTNAHVVLEEAPPRGVSGPSRPFQLIALSAPTMSGLEALTSRHAEYLAAHSDIDLADVAFTLLTGRKAFRHRRIVACRDSQEAVALLRAGPHGRVREGGDEPRHRPVVFMFPGQGAQYAGMANGVYQQEPVFRQHVDECLALLEQEGRLSLSSWLGSPATRIADRDLELGRTATTQPVLFTLEYALAKLWMSWGVQPECMLGHSIGEYVAACIAGVFSLTDALSLVTLRGRLMESMPAGAMLAVSLSERDIAPLLHDDLSLAAVNIPGQCVVSGSAQSIDDTAAELTRRGVEGVRLRTSHAFHSRMMDPIVDAFADAARAVDLHRPSIPFVSNVTGDWISDAEACDPRYWARHLRATVRFDAGLDRVLQERDRILLEIGPSHTLTTLARQHPRGSGERIIIDSLPDRYHRDDDRRHVLDALGRTWAAGAAIDWSAFYARERRFRVPLPTYPFERKRFWIDPPAPRPQQVEPPALPRRVEDSTAWLYVPTWTRKDAYDSEPAAEPRRWLIFDDGRAGEEIASRLQAGGHAVTRVFVGTAFRALSASEFSIHPDRAPDYVSLLRALEAGGRLPVDILHCWGASDESVSLDAAQQQGLSSLLHVVRGWAPRSAAPITITVLLRRAQQVLGADRVEPARAAVLGAAKVVPQEYPHIRVRTIDLDESGRGAMFDAVLEECLAPLTDPVIAYRGGSRWVQEHTPAPWLAKPTRTSVLKHGGTYLITGGFGNMGVTLAESLASRFQARLALMSRTPLPPRDEWDGWIARHGDDEPLSRRMTAVRELEALGAEVLIVEGDVADRAAVTRAIDSVDRRFGALSGVIHAAGAMASSAFRPISEIDAEACRQHFDPKAAGARNLAEVLRDRPLDFCMVVSSLSSVLGGVNFAAYAAANAYLDAFAQQRKTESTGCPWISVNWDGWQFDEPVQSRMGFSLTPAEGAETFRRILTMPLVSQVVVSTGELHDRLRRWVRFEDIPVTPAAGDTVASVHERPELVTSYSTPRTAVEQVIAEVWQAVLGLNTVGIDDNFFELGGHSLLAIQLVSRLRDLFQTSIALTALFEHPTVAALAEHINQITGSADDRMRELEQMLDYVEQLSPDQVQALLNEQQGD